MNMGPSMDAEPRCAWCSSAQSMEHEWTEIGSAYYVCPCCGKRTRMDSQGVAHRVQKPRPVIDCQGHLIDGP